MDSRRKALVACHVEYVPLAFDTTARKRRAQAEHGLTNRHSPEQTGSPPILSQGDSTAMTPSQHALATLDESLDEYRKAKRKGTTDLDPQAWLSRHVAPSTLAVLDEDATPCERSDCNPATCPSTKHDR